MTRQQATRFLTQATFGPTASDVNHLMSTGYAGWIDEQMAMPMNGLSHVAHWDAADARLLAVTDGQRASSGETTGSFWRRALSGQDQLRQRVAFALSEIFVVSMRDSCGDNAYSRGVADYLDMLGRQAFGSYRDLIESVALHPVMGCYLSHMKNQPADSRTGRVPDENFARELMQLFSIGLYELQMDGTLRTDGSGAPVETYGPSDISGLASVFTGWSWRCPQGLTSACFYSDPGMPVQYTGRMAAYSKYHSTDEKVFLGTRIGASMWATPQGSLKAALDRISAHPNVGPFLSKQLIQRLVTSNPSAAYVGRVSQAFVSSGSNLGAMVRAILLDPEARDDSKVNSDQFGKVREPILRFTALLRATGVHSDSGFYQLTNTTDEGQSLGQSPLSAPSVFNFFRPGFKSPGSQSASVGLLTPELQIANETTVAGYVNFMAGLVHHGVGRSGFDGKASRQDIQLDINTRDQHPWLALADHPTELVNEIDQALMYGTMPVGLAQKIADTLASIQGLDTLTTRRDRVRAALLLTVASPDFEVQK
ncbi:MAG TPA: DUF1800 domain-containing protein [Aquabacterium sp.]|uniref:DUF1800 domain-containing protein n=1 Tax=Aquabacterium sp. TaxID=1872578 RepID=UPI002E2F02C4|nr:DUF1800 domain-containing protein [Aquabacterium sp.]HEX5357300.1 DUF1800 domain-containing protein [Aquabacterium sp.]